jgi:transposase-like protein
VTISSGLRWLRSPSGATPVADVAKRLGVSQHSLCEWKKKFSKAPGPAGDDKEAEIRRLKRELARVTEERAI